jgi:hypothetical protein
MQLSDKGKIMKKSVAFLFLFFTLLPALVWASPPVPYGGKVAINGVNFFGQAKFAFAIHDANGTVHWQNGATANDTISVYVTNGRYVVHLGGQGMNPLPASLFANHDELYVRVSFDNNDGLGLRHLASDQRITAVPYALSAETAKTADSVLQGAITPQMIQPSSITIAQLNEQILKYLKPEITAQPQVQAVYPDSNASFFVIAEGKYLTYQWKKNGTDLAGQTNATLTITDANATLHDGNYSVVVSNDFGSVESGEVYLSFLNTEMDGLVGWWKFDETNGTIAYDSSGNANDGNLTNGPVWVSGKFGRALSFDGVNDRVRLPHSVIDGSVEISVSFWFKENQINTDHHHFISAASSSNANRLILGLKSNGLFNFCDDETNLITRMEYYYAEGFKTWSNVAIVRESSGAKLFVSGEMKASSSFQATQFTISPNGLWIGGEQDSLGGGWSSSQQLNGLLDDYRIYDRALSAAEVQALYNLGQ